MSHVNTQLQNIGATRTWNALALFLKVSSKTSCGMTSKTTLTDPCRYRAKRCFCISSSSSTEDHIQPHSQNLQRMYASDAYHSVRLIKTNIGQLMANGVAEMPSKIDTNTSCIKLLLVVLIKQLSFQHNV